MNCWSCGHRIETVERVGFHAHCERCDRPLHACRNCLFYDPGYNNQCRETMAERVVEKERSNFCEYFGPAAAGGEKRAAAAAPRPPERDARAEFDALFKKKKS